MGKSGLSQSLAAAPVFPLLCWLPNKILYGILEIMIDNSNYKILLVEDDEFIRELYVELLKDEGYKLDIAVNGEEGYKKMSAGGYDLVLLDIIMPKMDATQILKKLKSKPPKKKNKKILFMTNLAQERIVRNGEDYGVSGYMIKSDLTPEQFLNKVKENVQ